MIIKKSLKISDVQIKRVVEASFKYKNKNKTET